MSAQTKAQPKVLIAGGASYLGSKLASNLLSQNCNITVLDNLESGNLQNLQELLNSPNFKFIKLDITSKLPNDLGKFTHVYHLAGMEEYLAGTTPTHADLLVNSVGTDNLLKLAKDSKAKFILVSTLDVYSGIISQTSLENYFGPKSVDFVHFSHHEAKRFAESLVAAYFQNFGLDAAIGRIAQIYGPQMNLGSTDIIAKLINLALTGDTLVIPGDGLEILHPTYVDDIVWGLVKIGFSTATGGGIYNLVDPAEYTVLEFANRLKEVFGQIDREKTLEISFSQDSKSIKFPIPKVELTKTEHDLGWTPKVDLLTGIRQTLEFFRKKSPQTSEIEAPVITPQVETEKFQLPKFSFVLPKFSFPKLPVLPEIFRSGNLVIFALLALTFFLLILPIGQVSAGFVLGLKNFQDARAALLMADFEEAKIKAARAENWSRLAASGFARLKPTSILAGSQTFEDLNQNIKGVNLAISGFVSFVEIGQTASNLAKNVILGKNENLKNEISQLNLALTAAITDFETAKLDLVDFKLGKVPLIGKRAQNLISEFSKNLPNLKKGANFAQLLPEFLAQDSEKTYLVLFQNNSELRPGGGFIGSYGIFKFENGKLTSSLVDDIYNLDGQLKISLTPPEPLKKYLGVENWGLRDSNWHYDFSQNGARAVALYQQITGKTIDGVVGVDVETFTNLLKVLGPVKLPDYEEEITASNLSERAEFYSEIGFFPGSTSKKDFLASLARQIILKFEQNSRVNYSEIIKVLARMANEKHLNFYFANPELAAFFANSGWTGQIKPISVKSNGQIKIVSDFLALSEANVGANKANRFVERRIKLEPIVLRDGDLITTLTLDFFNKSPAPTWPGGNYKNYLRVITPIGSKLEQVFISEQDVTAVTEQLTEFDKQIFAVFLEVPAQESRRVIIKFRPNYRINILGDKATYNLLIQKQPGTGEDLTNIDLSYPAYLKVLKTNKPAQFSEQKINLQEKLSTDFDLEVEFSL